MNNIQERIAKENARHSKKTAECENLKYELSKYICPVTQDIFIDPYNTHCCGVDFERSALERWYANNNCCPNRCGPSTINDCNPSTTTRGKIITLKEDIVKCNKEIADITKALNRFKHMLVLCQDPKRSKIDAFVSLKTHPETNSDMYCIKTGTNKMGEQSVGIVLDTSGSMSVLNTITAEGETQQISNLEIVKKSGGMICKQLMDLDIKVFILKFGRTIEIISKPVYITSSNIDDILMKISCMKPEGDTNMIGGFEQAFKYITEETDANMTNLIMLTDGKPTPSYTAPYRIRGSNLSGIDDATFDLMEDYKLEGKVSIHMIGLGTTLERQSMLNITDKTGGNFYYMYDFALIPHITPHILHNILNKCCKSTIATFTFEESISEDDMKIVTKHLGELNNYKIDKNILTINFGSLNNNNETVFKLDNTFKPQKSVFKCITHTDRTYNLPIEEGGFDRECHNIRLTLVSTVNELQNNLYSNSITYEEVESKITELRKYMEDAQMEDPSNELYKTALIEALMDQIYIGMTDRENFNRWGHLHISAEIRNHFHTICSNFIQEAEQFYKTPEEVKILQKLNKAWVSFELPTPPILTYRGFGGGGGGGGGGRSGDGSRGSYPPPQEEPSISRTLSQAIANVVVDRGCFHPDCKIWISNDETICASKIEKNMIIMDPNGEEAVVECVIKHKCPDNMAPMSIYKDVALTPYHPFVPNKGKEGQDDKWAFPINEVGAENIYADYVYNFVLNTRESVLVGEERIKVCTLAHGIEGYCIGHSFFGTEEVVENLKTEFKEGYERGLIDNIGQIVRSQNTGRVIGYKK